MRDTRAFVACVVPHPHPDIESALEAEGWTVTAEPEGADALIWAAWGRPPEDIAGFLAPGIRWVQLPSAGIEQFVDSGVMDQDRIWTSAADAYSDQVAEQALALLLATRHEFPEAARNLTWKRAEYLPVGRSKVLIVGAGGIGRRLALMLAALGSEVLAVNRGGEPVPGATQTWPASELDEHWADAPNIVLAAPNTPETWHMVNAESLARMQPGTCLVNVGRGELIDSDALAQAIRSGIVTGAGLDVTEPEPLPDDHPLWKEPGVLISSHSANPSVVLAGSLVARVADNARRFAEGRELLGVIRLDLRY